ncbi:hypothetical protein NM688_g5174 [Phlebia brevispora]|uniref:Uncharacterized protein n=1 Tax=Phlebia brevispora TaxID=194682 RepID=A0ACC1SZH5_9APHY|nr:hypothetical protein NM688_g5174 [Phlebia brevispora]
MEPSTSHIRPNSRAPVHYCGFYVLLNSSAPVFVDMPVVHAQTSSLQVASTAGDRRHNIPSDIVPSNVLRARFVDVDESHNEAQALGNEYLDSPLSLTQSQTAPLGASAPSTLNAAVAETSMINEMLSRSPPSSGEVVCQPENSSCGTILSTESKFKLQPRIPTNDLVPVSEITVPEPKQTISSDMVSRRKMRRIRDTGIIVYWFHSASDYKILQPPPLNDDFGLAVGDIFIHKFASQSYQVWRCQAVRSIPLWESLEVGTQDKLPGQKYARAFVITDGGQPSWVLPDTVERFYKYLNARIFALKLVCENAAVLALKSTPLKQRI